MASSFGLYILVIITIFQFIIILRLISLRHADLQSSIQNQLIEDQTTVDVKNKKQSQDIKPTNTPLDGVAVTAFLDSPKWYARRYTLMIQNVANNLPDNWKIQIFHTGEGGSKMGFDINPGINRFIDRGLIELTLLPKELKRMRRMHIMLQPWFWSNIIADRVFIFGGGAVICSNSPLSINDFISYDYLGSPWGVKKGIGGEGGTAIGAISIRNRKHMLQAIEYAQSQIADAKERQTAYKEWGSEDHFFISTLLEMSDKNLIVTNIAPKEATYRFAAIGGYANESVLVAAGTLPDVEYGVRDRFLQYCPEMKVMFPSLHEPSCFGASPNGEECAKSICALKPKSERPSGC